MIPDHLWYTAEHEWIVGTGTGERAGAAEVYRVGVTDFAQRALGDVVFVQLPDAGSVVTRGEPLGEIESTKSVSEIYSPVSGAVVAVNEALVDQPGLINSDPYGEGWVVEIRPADGDKISGLLDAAGYRDLTEHA